MKNFIKISLLFLFAQNISAALKEEDLKSPRDFFTTLDLWSHQKRSHVQARFKAYNNLLEAELAKETTALKMERSWTLLFLNECFIGPDAVLQSYLYKSETQKAETLQLAFQISKNLLTLERRSDFYKEERYFRLLSGHLYLSYGKRIGEKALLNLTKFICELHTKGKEERQIFVRKFFRSCHANGPLMFSSVYQIPRITALHAVVFCDFSEVLEFILEEFKAEELWNSPGRWIRYDKDGTPTWLVKGAWTVAGYKAESCPETLQVFKKFFAENPSANETMRKELECLPVVGLAGNNRSLLDDLVLEDLPKGFDPILEAYGVKTTLPLVELFPEGAFPPKLLEGLSISISAISQGAEKERLIEGLQDSFRGLTKTAKRSSLGPLLLFFLRELRRENIKFEVLGGSERLELGGLYVVGNGVRKSSLKLNPRALLDFGAIGPEVLLHEATHMVAHTLYTKEGHSGLYPKDPQWAEAVEHDLKHSSPYFFVKDKLLGGYPKAFDPANEQAEELRYAEALAITVEGLANGAITEKEAETSKMVHYVREHFLNDVRTSLGK